MSTQSPDIRRNMQRALRRFERWRGAHAGRLPIPERLWAQRLNWLGSTGFFTPRGRCVWNTAS